MSEHGCTCANHGIRICREPNPVWDTRCSVHPDRWGELLPGFAHLAERVPVSGVVGDDERRDEHGD